MQASSPRVAGLLGTASLDALDPLPGKGTMFRDPGLDSGDCKSMRFGLRPAALMEHLVFTEPLILTRDLHQFGLNHAARDLCKEGLLSQAWKPRTYIGSYKFIEGIYLHVHYTKQPSIKDILSRTLFINTGPVLKLEV